MHDSASAQETVACVTPRRHVRKLYNVERDENVIVNREDGIGGDEIMRLEAVVERVDSLSDNDHLGATQLKLAQGWGCTA